MWRGCPRGGRDSGSTACGRRSEFPHLSDKLKGACASPYWFSEPEKKEVTEIYEDDQNNYLLPVEVTSNHMLSGEDILRSPHLC
jgi:hypothetical protein